MIKTFQCGDKKQAALCVASTKTVLDPTPLLLFDGVTERVRFPNSNTKIKQALKSLKTLVKTLINK